VEFNQKAVTKPTAVLLHRQLMQSDTERDRGSSGIRPLDNGHEMIHSFFSSMFDGIDVRQHALRHENSQILCHRQ
jgi:hypothetical protein